MDELNNYVFCVQKENILEKNNENIKLPKQGNQFFRANNNKNQKENFTNGIEAPFVQRT